MSQNTCNNCPLRCEIDKTVQRIEDAAQAAREKEFSNGIEHDLAHDTTAIQLERTGGTVDDARAALLGVSESYNEAVHAASLADIESGWAAKLRRTNEQSLVPALCDGPKRGFRILGNLIRVPLIGKEQCGSVMAKSALRALGLANKSSRDSQAALEAFRPNK